MVRVAPVPISPERAQQEWDHALQPTSSSSPSPKGTSLDAWSDNRLADEQDLRHRLRMKTISRKWRSTSETENTAELTAGAIARKSLLSSSESYLPPITIRSAEVSLPVASPEPPDTGQDKLGDSDITSVDNLLIQTEVECREPKQLNTEIVETRKDVFSTSEEKGEECAKAAEVDATATNIIVRRVLHLQTFLTCVCVILLIVVALCASSHPSIVKVLNLGEASHVTVVSGTTPLTLELSLGLLYFSLSNVSGDVRDGFLKYPTNFCYNESSPFFCDERTMR